MFNFLKMSVSPALFGNKLTDLYLSKSFQLEEGFMRGLAGRYTEEQLKTIRGEISALIALAYEAAVRQYVKREFQDTVLEHMMLHLGGPEVAAYSRSEDIGMTFMTRCGFERNRYLYNVGMTVFQAVKDRVKKFIRQVRIEEGGM